MKPPFRRQTVLFATACALLLPIFVFAQNVSPDPSPLLEMIRGGSLTKIADAVKANPALINAETDGEAPETPLSVALQIPNPQLRKTVVTILLDAGADVNLKFGENADTPLMHVVRTGDLESLDLLLTKRADLSARNAFGENSVKLARKQKDRRIFERLKEYAGTPQFKAAEEQRKNAFRAAAGNDVKTLSEILSSGFAVNTVREDGETLLSAAVQSDAADVAKLLLEKKASVNRKNILGMTPLMTAVRGKHSALAELLISGGADVNAADRYGMTALMFTAMLPENDAPVFADMLLKAGAIPDKADKYGATALMYSVRKSNLLLAEKLLKAGADPDLKDASGTAAGAMTSDPAMKKILTETKKAAE